MKCPTCHERPAVVLLESTQPCEACYAAARRKTTPAPSNREQTTVEVLTASPGVVFAAQTPYGMYRFIVADSRGTAHLWNPIFRRWIEEPLLEGYIILCRASEQELADVGPWLC